MLLISGSRNKSSHIKEKLVKCQKLADLVHAVNCETLI